MSYDAFLIVLALIGALSGLIFLLGIISDILWPAIERGLLWSQRPRSQATYRRRHP